MSRNKILFILSIALYILFIVWSILVLNGVTQTVDDKVVEFVVSFRGEQYGFWYWFSRILTELGYVYVLVTICVLSLVFLKLNMSSLFIAGGTLTNYLTNEVFKHFAKRERPLEALRWMSEHSSSYPSGHSQSSMFAYFILAYMIYNSNLNKKIKYPLFIITLIIPFIVGFTRVVLSVHYLSDVLGGFMFALANLFLALGIYEVLKSKGYSRGLGKFIFKE